MAADFNRTAQQLEGTGWLKMVGGKIISPNHPTCKNRVIDFFVVSNNLVGMVVGAITVGDALCKPHCPVRLYLEADARTMAVRMLKKIGKLPVVLPCGPALLHDDLGDIGNLTQDVGRTEGPKFVQRNALERAGGNEENDHCVKCLASQCRVA